MGRAGRVRGFARVATLSGAIVLLATACTQVAGGTATWNAGEASAPVDDVGDIVVSLDQVNQVVDGELDELDNLDEPFAQGDFEECYQLLGVGLAGYLGDDWDGFSYLLYSDATDDDGPNNVVVQSVALYPDAQDAQDAYDAMSSDNLGCDGHTTTTDSAEWTQSVDDDPADGVAVWSSEQTDSIDPWMCSGQAQVRNNALLRVYVCDGGNDGPELAEELMAVMAAAVWEHSAPN